MTWILWLTWCIPQTLVGLGYFLIVRLRGSATTWTYRGVVATQAHLGAGVSLGPFIFLPMGPDQDMEAHEWGHTRQSLLLGPLYLLAIGIPSALWAAAWLRHRPPRPDYFSFWTEAWANELGGVL